MRRPISTTLKLVATGFILVVAACAPVPTDVTYQPAAEAGDKAAPAGDEAARDELRAAIDRLGVEPVSFEVSVGDVMTITGSVIPVIPSGRATMSAAGVEADLEVIYIGTELWLSMGDDLHEQLGVGAKWMYADLDWLSRLAELADIDPDQVFGQLFGHDPEVLAASLGEVVKIDDHTFEGVIDPVAGYTATFGDLMPPELAGEELPFEFTAVVDGGRLMQLTVKAGPPQGGGYITVESRYFHHGMQADISPPPVEEVSPMPEEVLAALLGFGE